MKIIYSKMDKQLTVTGLSKGERDDLEVYLNRCGIRCGSGYEVSAPDNEWTVWIDLTHTTKKLAEGAIQKWHKMK